MDATCAVPATKICVPLAAALWLHVYMRLLPVVSKHGSSREDLQCYRSEERAASTASLSS